jgi:hypothetical protein
MGGNLMNDGLMTQMDTVKIPQGNGRWSDGSG